MLAIAIAATVVAALVFRHRLGVDYLTHDGACYLNLAGQLRSGQGFTSRVLWLTWLDPGRLPFPYGNPGGPLYPLLVAFAGLFTPDLLGAGLVVNGVLFAALLVVIAALADRLGARWPWPLLGSALAASSAWLLRPSMMPVSDLLATVLGAAALFAALGSAPRRAPVVAGILAGLAYLARYQMLALLPGLALCLLFGAARPRRPAARTLALLGIAFLATASPWLVRNMLVFGAPVHTYASRYFGLLGFERAGLDPVGIWQRATVPPSPWGYAWAHPGAYLDGLIHRAGVELALWPLDGSLATAFSLVGIWAVRRRGFGGAYVIMALLGAFFAVTYFEARYLLLVVPISCALAAVGAAWCTARLAGMPKAAWLLAVLLLCAFGGRAIGCYRLFHEDPRAPGYVDALRAAARVIDARPPLDGTVMAGMLPEIASFATRRPAVSFPLVDGDAWWRWVERYRVRTLLLTDAERVQLTGAAWRETVLPHLDEVWRDDAAGLSLFAVREPAALR